MVEFTLLALVAVAAVAGMQTYLQRGLAAKIKGNADDLFRTFIGLSKGCSDDDDSTPCERIPDDGTIEPLGEPTQRRGTLAVERPVEGAPPIVCPDGTSIPDGVSCFETTQDRDVEERYLAADGMITKEIIKDETTTVSTGTQVFRELLGEAQPAPPPSE